MMPGQVALLPSLPRGLRPEAAGLGVGGADTWMEPGVWCLNPGISAAEILEPQSVQA